MNKLANCTRTAEFSDIEIESTLAKDSCLTVSHGLTVKRELTVSSGLTVSSELSVKTLRLSEGPLRSGGPCGDVQMLSKPAPCHSRKANLKVNPEFTVVRSDYRVRLASKETRLHTRASKLVDSMYGSRGLMTADSTPVESPAQQVTLAASSGERVFGTLTLGVDSGTGLLADTLYGNEIDQLRQQGCRVCEVTRLALDPELNSQEVMATIFNVAFVLARAVHASTDLIAEVHPRHASFYQRTMGYRVAGPVRTCDRVNAPAVLMHLCLDFATTQIHQFAGTSPQGERSLYRLFLPAAEQEVLLEKITEPALCTLPY